MSEEKRYCRNCHTELHGTFCSSCGQRDSNMHIPVTELFTEFADILPDFDKRLFRSITPFLFKPGFLTLEYLSGKRKRYISPFKLYLFVSFVFFFASSFIDTPEYRTTSNNVVQPDSLKGQSQNDTAYFTLNYPNSNLKFTAHDSTDVDQYFGPSMISALKKINTNPQLMFEKMKEHRPKLIFLLMPVFALLLKLLYLRSNTLYIKHLVFSFYFHSFIFCILFIIDIMVLTGVGFLNSFSRLAYLCIPPYLYFGLVRVYGQSRRKTALKMLLLTASYSMTFLIGITLATLLIIILFYL